MCGGGGGGGWGAGYEVLMKSFVPFAFNIAVIYSPPHPYPHPVFFFFNLIIWKKKKRHKSSTIDFRLGEGRVKATSGNVKSLGGGGRGTLLGLLKPYVTCVMVGSMAVLDSCPQDCQEQG